MPITDRFRSQCRLLRAASLVVFVGLFLLLAIGMVGLPWRMATDMPEGWSTRALLSVVQFLPGLGYLWALWAVQHALGDRAAARWHPTVARAMRHIVMACCWCSAQCLRGDQPVALDRRRAGRLPVFDRPPRSGWWFRPGAPGAAGGQDVRCRPSWPNH